MATQQPAQRSPLSRHDPRIGYSYCPGAAQTLPTPDGRSYLVRVNNQGIRGNREFSPEIPDGKFRIAALGDSLTAGLFCANEDRFTERLEAGRDDLEVINFALEGTGTDQQLLIFEDRMLRFDFDLMLFCPYVENIRRNLVDYRVAIDPNTMRRMLVPKPRFELVDGRLDLRNVPVPDERFPIERVSRDMLDRAPAAARTNRVRAFTNRMLRKLRIKRLVYHVTRYEPFPDYRDPNSKGWRLMAAMIERFVEQLAGRPLVIVPLVYRSYLEFNLAGNYLKRFRSLDRPGLVRILDILPVLRRLEPEQRRACYWPDDCHFTPYGHRVVADAIAAELRKAGVIPVGQSELPKRAML